MGAAFAEELGPSEDIYVSITVRSDDVEETGSPGPASETRVCHYTGNHAGRPSVPVRTQVDEILGAVSHSSVELSYIASNSVSPRISSSTPLVSVTSPNTVAR